MGDGVKLFIFAVALVGVLWFLVRGLRPRGGPGSTGAKTMNQLARYTSGPATSGLVTGFITVMGLIVLVRGNTPGTAESGIALASGIIFAIASTPGALFFRTVAAAVVGLLGIIPTFEELTATSQCTPTNTAFNVTLGVLLIVGAALAAVLSSLLGGTPKFRWATLLGSGSTRWLLIPAAIFGGLQTVLFLAMPMGVSLSMTLSPSLATVVAFVGAVALGLLIGFVPGLALVLACGAIAFTQTFVYAAWGTACAPAVGVGAVTPLVVFFISYAVVVMMFKPFRRTQAAQ